MCMTMMMISCSCHRWHGKWERMESRQLSRSFLFLYLRSMLSFHFRGFFFLISIHFLISLHILQFVLMVYMFRSISPSIYLNVLLVPHPFPAVRPWEISVLEWVIYFTSIFKLAKRAKMRKFSTIRSCLGGPEFGALVE